MGQQDSTMGRWDATGAAPQVAVDDGQPSVCRQPAVAPQRAIAWLLISRVLAIGSFSYLLLFLRTSQGCLRTNRSSFSLALTLKTLLGRNKVVRLGLFWIVFWIQALGFHLLQSIYSKFLFLFSFLLLVCSYFFC